MRTFLLTSGFALILFTGLRAEKILRGSDAAQTIAGTELIRYADGVANPVYIRFETGKGPLATEFTGWLKSALHLDAGFEFNMTKGEDDALGWTHFSYQQMYRGIPVEFAKVKAHVIGNRVISVSGYSVQEVPITASTMNESAAFALALGHVQASLYKWELPEEEAFLKAETGDAEATFFPSGKLVYLPSGADFSRNVVPCWKFDIYAHRPISRTNVYVNAASGEIELGNALLQHADSVGTAQTSFSGTRTITTDYISSSNSFRLRESGRGNGIQTLDMLNGTSYGAAADLTHQDNNWPDSSRLSYSTDAHWGAELTYDYYLSHHSRNSIDGNGFVLRSYVHYDVNYNNAFWDGQRMTYGDGSGSAKPYTSLDIAGHEITHGLTSHTAELIYSNESGAINESFSDIFGCIIEYYYKPNPSNNWLVGEDRGSSIRSMSNPNSKGDPDTYLGNSWYSGTADNGGVHTNSGVQNYWFYLLANGGSGTNDNSAAYSVTGIGVAKADNIVFRNLTVYLSATANYQDARFFAIQSAIDLYGSCSPELASTVNAWYAVGVGSAYQPNVVSEFSANTTSPCNLPATIQFTNLSNFNAKTYTWNFGDGQTSTAVNPTHDYTAPGTYTVKLTAVGEPACGQDIETKTSYIVVAPPADASADDITICDGDGAVINATATNTVYWYSSMTTTSPLHVGKEFRSSALFVDTVFYMQNVIEAPVQSVGPANNTFGNGGNFNNDQHLVFDAYDQFTLESVKVFAQGDKFRTIELRDNNGTVLQTRSDFIRDGEQTFTLGFIISPGTDYQLGIPSSSNPDLYRNNSGANYPYTVPGVVSITRSSANTTPLNYYYYFYDWKVKQKDCFGQRIPVNVFIDYDPNCVSIYNGVESLTDAEEIIVYPNPSSGSFHISMNLPEAQELDVKLINASGAVARHLPAREYRAGAIDIPMEAGDLNSGIYVLIVEGASVYHTQRIAIE